MTYSNYLIDGTIIKSIAGLEVTIRLVGNDIYFNDAKVVSPNVMYADPFSLAFIVPWKKC